MRPVVGVDRDPDEDDATECPLPAFEDPNLPDRFKENYFGCPNTYDGFVYESQPAYLARLKLLTREEAAILKKYGEISSVRVSSGIFGQCAPCWKTAHELAKKIDFDLTAAIKFQQFWIPEDLISDCEHSPGMGQGIFSYL